jgi:hypothetical protein
MPSPRNPRDNVMQRVRGSVAAAFHLPRNKRDVKPQREVPVSNPITRRADSGGCAAVVGTGVARTKRDESLNVCGDAICINSIEHADDARIEQWVRGEGR